MTKTMAQSQLCFCKDCGSHNSWVRCPERDWKTDNGEIVEFSYRCSVCGNLTLRREASVCGRPVSIHPSSFVDYDEEGQDNV